MDASVSIPPTALQDLSEADAKQIIDCIVGKLPVDVSVTALTPEQLQ